MGIKIKKEEVAAVVTKQHKDGSLEEETIPVGVIQSPKDRAVVEVNMSMTRNLGNYESVKISVSLAMPCSPEKITDVYDEVKAWVDDKINSVNQEINASLQ